MSPRYRSRVSNAAGNNGARDYREATAKQIDQEVRKLQDDAYQLARTTLMADRDKLERIAKALQEYETSDGFKRGPAARQENAGEKPAWFIGSHCARNGGPDLDRTR